MLSVTVKCLRLWLASPSSFSPSNENEVWGIYDSDGEIKAGSKGESNTTKFLYLQWRIGRGLVLSTFAYLKVTEEGGLDCTGLLLWGVTQAWQLTQIPWGLGSGLWLIGKLTAAPTPHSDPQSQHQSQRLHYTLSKRCADTYPSDSLTCVRLFSVNCLHSLEIRN